MPSFDRPPNSRDDDKPARQERLGLELVDLRARVEKQDTLIAELQARVGDDLSRILVLLNALELARRTIENATITEAATAAEVLRIRGEKRAYASSSSWRITAPLRKMATATRVLLRDPVLFWSLLHLSLTQPKRFDPAAEPHPAEEGLRCTPDTLKYALAARVHEELSYLRGKRHKDPVSATVEGRR